MNERTTDSKIGFLSTRIRSKAVELIALFGRPLSAHEILVQLRGSDRQLWDQVVQKCEDYMRVILSQTKNNVFKKFRSKNQIRDVDRRTIFYGLRDSVYSAADWVPVEETQRGQLLPFEPTGHGVQANPDDLWELDPSQLD